MQHVYSHAENLGNECADHAALGAFGIEPTFPHVGRVTPLIPLHALLPATTLAYVGKAT